MIERLAASLLHYKVRCPACQTTFDDDGWLLECPTPHEPALLVTEYSAHQLMPDEHATGIARYRSWLPTFRSLPEAGGIVTYQSGRLSAALGLPHLWIAFSGYWPEQGATLETATFKDLEASTVLAHLPEPRDRVLVVASAGNTAAAFANACSRQRLSCLLIIPETGLPRMQFADALDPCVKIVSLVGFTDYYDAIRLANRVSRLEGFFSHGGGRDLAVRDGLGTALLNATETIGRLPDYYFQAIGSGTGAIAAHEVAKRLVRDGRFGHALPRLMLSQNFPFVPMYLSWKAQQRELIPINEDDGKKQIRQIIAHVLSNQRPPYAVAGGVFDVLTESRGDILVTDNFETLRAMALFEACEGIDIDPAAGVALATLSKAAANGQIDRNAIVLLHVTGGGWYQHGSRHRLIPVKPVLQIDEHEIASENTLETIVKICG